MKQENCDHTKNCNFALTVSLHYIVKLTSAKTSDIDGNDADEDDNCNVMLTDQL